MSSEEKSELEARKDYPGAAVNEADRDKVSEKLVDERTKDLNNNPRNTDGPKPGAK